MAIELIRIDDRLIHGQVVTTWVKQKGIEQILIINDSITNDPVQKSVFDMMAPQDVIVRTFGVEQFAEIYQKTAIKRKTLLLLTNPVDVETLLDGGVQFNYLNLGGMKYTSTRTRYTRAISLDEREKQALVNISNKGVKVSVQMIPLDKEIHISELIEGEG
ncbi:hypothetical protein A5806_001424 [Enterococcus faecium]|uniref:PTS system mannose/fructose/N-acetylgalactosamine-transporter subunit IIB n=1 Tax=Enterococcus faecium TaxID=1352 RepID=UPI000B3EB26E|nr:PTS sugar transporter subunit IIB [Enterococcus faecium]OUZ28686.1 hypothetical protein A5806_001424 [Enterococcus faecium]